MSEIELPLSPDEAKPTKGVWLIERKTRTNIFEAVDPVTELPEAINGAEKVTRFENREATQPTIDIIGDENIEEIPQ